MAVQLPNGRNYFEATGGGPAVGYKLYTYVPNSSTLKDTYTTALGNIANQNPVVMDSRGEAAIYWVGSYDVILKTNADVTVWGPERLEDSGGNLRTDLAASSGSSLVGYIQAGTGAVAYPVQTRLRISINLEDFGGIGDDSTDTSSAFLAAVTRLKALGGGKLKCGRGIFKFSSRQKIQQTLTSNIHIIVEGAGNGNAFVGPLSCGTIFVGDTAGIFFDCAGGSNLTFLDIGFFAGSSSPSTIGILFQRIASDAYVQKIQFHRCTIAMGTNPSANGGVGTIGLLNRRGEHHHYYDCWFYADNPVICLGNSAYPTLVSPDFAESGATSLSLNYFHNCNFIAASGHAVEWLAAYEMHIEGGYFQIANGKAGLSTVGAFIERFSVNDANAELGPGGGTPACLIRVGAAFGLTARTTTQLPALDMIRTVGGGSSIRGFDVAAGGTFGAIFNPTTEGGGPMLGGTMKYNSINGHTTPGFSFAEVYQSILMDAGSTVAQMDIRANPSGTTVFSTGQMVPPTATTGADTTPVVTETYYCEIFLPSSINVSGVKVLQGTAASGNFQVGFYDHTGVLLAQSASTSTAGQTADYILANFTSAYLAKGPGRYYIAVQYNNTSNRFRTHQIGGFTAGKITSTVYGTLPNPLVPSGFLSGAGPIACTF